ncbi:MAG: hypothetical protein ACD_41C00369G0005 [uncultured bacterium]|nr:MAG: hypothetical protein ACD_41C00369G0005 [uncultured bacterium]HBY74157.1 agmatine deiminase [Candidatus Kerfeldbacteria bacterium]
MNETPKQLGYHMPAEWEPHTAIWLAWPHDPDSFPQLEQAEWAFADFVAVISKTEHIELHVLNDVMEQKVMSLLQQRQCHLSAIRFHHTNYADIWIRDYGPIFVVNPTTKQLAMTKWEYNAYGNKYTELLKDNDVPYIMNQSLQLPMFKTGIVLEGGSVDVNGLGTLLTTRQCLLNANRNPRLSEQQIESYLSDYLGVQHVIWLNEGIEGDDTDGHIDDIARFINPTTVVCVYTDDTSLVDYKPLHENYQLLTQAVDQAGQPLTIIKLPMPAVPKAGSRQLPASYTNFYIGNGVVIVPTFGTNNDQTVLERLRPLFPGRQVIGLNAYHIVFGAGTFHCMSQQQPAVR